MTGRNWGGLGEIVSTIGVGVAFAPATPRALALPRTFVMRTMRLPLVPGGSIGTPRNVTELEVVWIAWNTFLLLPGRQPLAGAGIVGQGTPPTPVALTPTGPPP